MNEDKNQETLLTTQDFQDFIDAFKKEFGNDPDFLRKVERWEEIERIRKTELSRFPPPKGMWTLSKIKKGIKEKDPEAYSAHVHSIYSNGMMRLTFDALFRDDIHKFIAKHAGSQIDDYFLRYVAELPMTSEEFLKLHERLKHQGSEDDIQDALTELFECWHDQKPYLTLLEKVVAGEFAKILPAVVKHKRVDEYREMERFVSLDKDVKTANGSKVLMLEFLMSESESLQTQPEQIEEELTEEQRQQLEQLLGKTGLEIWKYRHQHQWLIGQHSEKKIIAQALGIAESTVGRYIGTKNRIGIIEENADKILEILS